VMSKIVSSLVVGLLIYNFSEEHPVLAMRDVKFRGHEILMSVGEQF